MDEATGTLVEQNQRHRIVLAKLMARSKYAVPRYLQGNAEDCYYIITQARKWKLGEYDVANKSYEVGGRIGFESQLIHAVIEARAPIAGRLNYEIKGEGDERRCMVWATLKGESTPRYFTSETLAHLRPPKNEKGERKGSPLWEKKPEVQLFYNASRDWCRIFCPDVILGVYTRDELEEMADSRAIYETLPASPNLLERLPGRIDGPGFTGGVNPDASEPAAVASPISQTEVAATTPPANGKKRRAKPVEGSTDAAT